MSLLRPKQPTLRAAVQDCRAAVEQLTDAAGKAVLYAADFTKLAKFCKRLGPLLDEIQENTLDALAQQEGVRAFKQVTAALQHSSDFATQCTAIGPVHALISSISLAQQLTNCSINLCAALSAVDAAALGASADLQEDLAQYVRQLARMDVCCYSEQQHTLLFELHVQAEAVRSGRSDASTLSAILTQQVLQQCTVAQLGADVAYLQQAAAAEGQAGNHVGQAFYQQLATICQALLPEDAAGSASSLVPALKRMSTSAHSQPDSTIAATDLITTLTSTSTVGNSGGGNATTDQLQAGLALMSALSLSASEAKFLPPEMTLAVTAAELPLAAAQDVLQVLSDPAIAKACVDVLAAPGAANGEADHMLKQIVACVLERAAAAEPAVAGAFVASGGRSNTIAGRTSGDSSNGGAAGSGNVGGRSSSSSSSSCSSGSSGCHSSSSSSSSPLAVLARLVTSSNTTVVLRSAVLELLCTLSSNDTIAQQVVEQQKLIPALVQLLGEVKVVKGKSAVSVAAANATAPAATTAAAAAAASAGPKGAAAGGKQSTAAAASQGRGTAASVGSAAAGRRGVTAADGAAAAAAAAPAACARADVTLAALKLLQVLSAKFWVVMEAAGVMPAIVNLLCGPSGSSSSAAAAAAAGAHMSMQLEALQLLTLLLQQDKSTAVEVMRNNGLQCLAVIYEQSITGGSSGDDRLHKAASAALLLLLRSPVTVGDGDGAVPAPEPVLVLKQHTPAASDSGRNSPVVNAAPSRGQWQAAGKTEIRAAAEDFKSDTAAGRWSGSSSLEEVQVELGRWCSPASVEAGMQLLSLGSCELVLPLLSVLLAATSSSQEARLAAFGHAAGMAAVLQLSTAVPTPAFGPSRVAAGGDDAGAGASGAESCSIAAVAAALLVQIGEERQIRPALAKPLAQVLLNGAQQNVASAAWLVSHLAACRSEADKAATKAAGEFCAQLAAAGGLPPLLDLLRHSNAEAKGAGVAAIRSLARSGDSSIQGALLSGGAVPPLVDVIRSTAAGEPLAAAATAALAGFTAAVGVPGAAAAVCDLLVSCLQPSSPGVAANAGAALLELAVASPEAAHQLVSAGAVPALLKLLQQQSSSGPCLDASRAAALLLAFLLRCNIASSGGSSSGGSSSSSSSSSSPTKKRQGSAVSASCPAAAAARSAAAADSSGSNSSAAASKQDVPDGAVAVLLAALKLRDDDLRLSAAAALGQLIRRPTAVAEREAVVAAQAVPDLLDILRSTAPPPTTASGSATGSAPALVPAATAAAAGGSLWVWEDAAAGLASMGAQHSIACSDLAKGLRQMVLRGSVRDAAAPAAVAAKLAASPRGRAALLTEGVLAGLVGVVGNPACSAAARAAAADAIGAIAVPASVVLDSGLGDGEAAATGPAARGTVAAAVSPSRVRRSDAVSSSSNSSSGQQQQQGLPGVRIVDPKLEAVRSGAVAALIGLVRAGAGDVCVLEACESLYVLAGCQAGKDAAVAAGAKDVLQEVVLAGKRREVGEKAAKAAYEALMRLL